MLTKITLSHRLSDEAYAAVRERLDPGAGPAKRVSFTYGGPVTSITLIAPDAKKNQDGIMQTTLDCAERGDEAFRAWVKRIYNKIIDVKSIPFPPDDEWACEYAEYSQRIPADNPQKSIDKATGAGRWLPEQLDKALWDQYKRKPGQYNTYLSPDGASHILLRSVCDTALMKKRCGEANLRAGGVSLDYALDPDTEENMLSVWKTKAMSANRVNKNAYEPGDIIKVLPTEYKPPATDFIALAGRHRLKPAVRYAPGRKLWKCVYSSDKPKRVILTVETSPSGLRVKANLFSLQNYLAPQDLSSEVKSQLVDNCWTCGPCPGGRCRGGVRFELEGKSHFKCIGGAFTFINLSPGDFAKVMDLTELELKESRL